MEIERERTLKLEQGELPLENAFELLQRNIDSIENICETMQELD
jgi:exonuclease VII small subunit